MTRYKAILEDQEMKAILTKLEPHASDPEIQSIIKHLNNLQPANTIPESIKDDNWRLFEQAMSPDPAIAGQYSVKVVTHLMLTMDMAGLTAYDKLLKDSLETARKSLAAYSQSEEKGHEGECLQLASEVVSKIGFLLYDDRFATRDKHAFTGR